MKIDNAEPRVTLAKTGILKIPIANVALNAEGPKTAVINIAITNAGNAKTTSLLRIKISSSQLSTLLAAINPMGTPIITPINLF